MSTPVLARHDGADREAPDDAHGRLVARVAAGADEHREEEDLKRARRKGGRTRGRRAADDDRVALDDVGVALEHEAAQRLRGEEAHEPAPAARRAPREVAERLVGRGAAPRRRGAAVDVVDVARLGPRARRGLAGVGRGRGSRRRILHVRAHCERALPLLVGLEPRAQLAPLRLEGQELLDDALARDDAPELPRRRRPRRGRAQHDEPQSPRQEHEEPQSPQRRRRMRIKALGFRSLKFKLEFKEFE